MQLRGMCMHAYILYISWKEGEGAREKNKKELLCFEWSPPWHSIHPIWQSIWHIYLAFHLACLLTFYPAYLLTFYLAYLLTFYLAFYLTFNILSGISSDILPGISSDILSVISSDILSAISSDILSGILSGVSSDILSGISSDILSGISSDILPGISSDILSGILSDILHFIWHIFWHSIWHIFWHSIWHIFWHSIWHSIWRSIWHIFWHIFWHSLRRLKSGREHLAWILAVEVRQGTLGVDGRSWGPAGNTWRGFSRLRSGREHLAWMVVVEVRRRRKAAEGGRRRHEAAGVGRRRRKSTDIKSNNPHLAGGEEKSISGGRPLHALTAADLFKTILSRTPISRIAATPSTISSIFCFPIHNLPEFFPLLAKWPNLRRSLALKRPETAPIQVVAVVEIDGSGQSRGRLLAPLQDLEVQEIALENGRKWTIDRWFSKVLVYQRLDPFFGKSLFWELTMQTEGLRFFVKIILIEPSEILCVVVKCGRFMEIQC